jgi:hypothetical protein
MSIRGKALLSLLSVCAAFGYDLEVNTSSKNVYQGEPLLLTYRFARPAKDETIDFRFAAPELAHFQVLDSRSAEGRRGRMLVWQKEYVVAPLQAGELTTGTAAMNVAKRVYKKDAWGQWMPSTQWEQHRFERAALFANPAPTGIQAVGRFRLTAVTDRNETDSGKPVRLILSLKGCGNLRMAEPLRLAVSGVSVFEEGATHRSQWRDGCYDSESNRTFALVGTSDFTIPSVTFRSFDPKHMEVVTAQTLPIDIRVNAVAKPEKRTSAREEEKMTVLSVAAGVFAGFGLGVAATLLLLRRKKHERGVRHDSLRAALIELFKHLDDPEAKQSAEAVEKHLYEGAEKPDGEGISKVLSRLKRGAGKDLNV